MSDYPDLPLALQQPNRNLCIRPVMLADATCLHTHLWQHRDINSIEEFIQRGIAFHDKNRGIGIVVVDDNQPAFICAYGQVTHWVKCAEISDLFVHPLYRNRGIGTAMIQYLSRHILQQKLSCVELGVAESNPRALALYRRLGLHDSYALQLDLGRGAESVIYLRLDLTPYNST